VNEIKLCPRRARRIFPRVEEVRFTIFGSGSGGNAAYLETPGARVLVDCGFSAKRIRNALLALDRTPERLDGILITHEHIDHIQALRVLNAKLGIPVYCNRHTADEIRRIHKCDFEFRIFETGQPFEVGDLSVETFPVPHDAIETVGFVIHTAAARIGWLTDLGHGTRLIADRVRECEILLLETNHDLDLLRNDPLRPPHLKQRITSRHGHLSNEGAADFLEQILHPNLRHIYCVHLSSDCNSPEIVRTEITAKLAALGAEHVQVHLTEQTAPCPTLVLPINSQAILAQKSVATVAAAL
jgi:phosphoribosyl 1,2-cyclic phosphodiesterase